MKLQQSWWITCFSEVKERASYGESPSRSQGSDPTVALLLTASGSLP